MDEGMDGGLDVEVVGGTTAPPSTGDEAVDAVLREVSELDRRPLAEHATVFESAQERLRHALDVPDRA